MHNRLNNLSRAVRLASLAAIVTPATVAAGGFSLNEQSASAMGTANAGAAANPENASTVTFNPAGMSQLSGTNISFGASVLDIDAEARAGSVSATDQVGADVPGSNGGDIADPAVLPNFYLTHEVSDSIDVGFGIHAPYGLAADYDDDFVGRYFADKTELTAIAFTPSVSVNNGEGLSMGLGLNIMYAEGRLTKFQDYSGAYAQAMQQTGGALVGTFEPGYADIEGDDIGVTFRVGFLYEMSEQTQLGLSAQTGTELKLKGNGEISNYPAVIINGGVPTAVQADVTRDVEVPLEIPESVTAGIRHNLTDDVTLLAGATYARWGRFEELDIVDRDGGTVITHITEKWKNTWQFNVGGIWQATPEWAFKAGYAWDESPVDQYVTARVPSEDRHWLTLGSQWKDVQSGWTVDAAIGTLIFVDDAEVDEYSYLHDAPETVDPTSGASNYKGTYDLSAWSASVQISKAF